MALKNPWALLKNSPVSDEEDPTQAILNMEAGLPSRSPTSVGNGYDPSDKIKQILGKVNAPPSAPQVPSDQPIPGPDVSQSQPLPVSQDSTPATNSDFSQMNVPLAAKGSGQEFDYSKKKDKEAKTTNQIANVLGSKEFQEAYKNFSDLPQFQDQQNGLKALDALYSAQSAQTPPLNIKPLAALADYVAPGGTALKGYESPESTPDFQKRLVGMAAKSQGDKAALAKEIIDAVAKQKAGYKTDLQRFAETLVEGEKNKDPNALTKNYAVTNFNKFATLVRTTNSDDDKEAKSISNIIDEVKQGNPINDNRIAVIRASADAKGRPNMAEVQMESGNKQIVARGLQALNWLYNGTLTRANRDLQLQSLQAISDLFAERRKVMQARLADMGQKGYGLSPEQVNATLPESYVNNYPKYTGEPNTALGETKEGKTGKYKKIKVGPDSDKANWELVK